MLTDLQRTELATDLETIRAEVQASCDHIGMLPIDNQNDLDSLGNGVKAVKATGQKLDDDRKALIDVHQKYVTQINEIYRAPIRAYQALEQAVKARIARHAREQQQAQHAAQLAAGQAFQAGDTKAAHTALAAAPAPAQTAGVSVRKFWDVEIVDELAVPRIFLAVDMPALRAHVRITNGAPVAGCRVFENSNVIVRSK